MGGNRCGLEEVTLGFRHGNITRTPSWYVDPVIDSAVLLLADRNGALVSAPLLAKPTSPDSSTDRAASQVIPSSTSLDFSPGADANARLARPVRRGTSGAFSSAIPPFERASLL